jgi:hypothetical protein
MIIFEYSMCTCLHDLHIIKLLELSIWDEKHVHFFLLIHIEWWNCSENSFISFCSQQKPLRVIGLKLLQLTSIIFEIPGFSIVLPPSLLRPPADWSYPIYRKSAYMTWRQPGLLQSIVLSWPPRLTIFPIKTTTLHAPMYAWELTAYVLLGLDFDKLLGLSVTYKMKLLTYRQTFLS